MGFLQRRRTPAPATHTESGSPAVPQRPTIARLAWRNEERTGWLRFPDPVLKAITSAGFCRTPALTAWAYEPAARRTPDGQYWQDVDGWWIDTVTLLSVRARRPLLADGTADDGRPRLRAGSGSWTVHLTASPLSGSRPTVQRWSRPRPIGEALPRTPEPEVRVSGSAVELLPRAVQDEIGLPTGQGAIRTFPAVGGFCDQVHAHRRDHGELVAVYAVRQAGAYPDPDTAIDAADWHVTTHRAAVGDPVSRTLGLR